MKIFNPLQELDTSPDSEFARAIDRIVAGMKFDDKLKPVIVGYTPIVLRLCADLDIIEFRMRWGDMWKAMRDYLGLQPLYNKDGEELGHHNLSPEQLKQIPVAICDPIAVIQSQTKADYRDDDKNTKPKLNGLVVLTELFETDKFTKQQKPIIAAVHLLTKNKKLIDCKITSAYGKGNRFVLNNLSSSLLMYLNREKCRHLFLNHLNTPNVRQEFRRDDDNEKLKIIAELCELEIHKGRYQLKTYRSHNDRELSHQTENDHLYDPNDTQKPTIMQAIKEKISPKQPKRTIPMPTGYKTEEDLQRFYQEIMQKPLTKEQAKLVGKDMISQVEPMNHIEFIELFNNHIEKVYNNGGDTNIQSIQNCIQQMVKKIPDILKAQQAQTQTQPEKNQSKEKGDGGRER